MARWTRPRRRIVPVFRALLLLAALALAPAPRAGAAQEPQRAASLRFAYDGKTVAELDLGELRDRRDPRRVRVFEPYEQREAVFEAIPLEPLLDAVYGARWREREEILFTCRDGYQPTVPVPRVVEHEPWLAFDRADRDGFAISKRESGRRQRISLAPFYVIWENLGDARVRAEGDYGWPYQLVGIDLIRTRDRFPDMVPPEDAGEQVWAGFTAFRIHCSRCHAINGEGGALGPELNGPARPVEYRSAEWLRRWIDDPGRIVETARMPRLDPSLPDRARTIDAILAYLKAMARAGRAAGADGGG